MKLLNRLLRNGIGETFHSLVFQKKIRWKLFKWKNISGLLCILGFVRKFRPSEPFLTEFLAGSWRNVTTDQLNRLVYPMCTYSYSAQLVVVFLITDFLLYKPLIITIGVAGIIIWSMLLWTTSLEALMTLEFFYGTYMAAEVAYYPYIYAKVDKKYYTRVTSHTRAAMFSGKMVACISAQLLLYFDLMDYRELNYITLTAQILATLLAFTLPKVNRSLYFHRQSVSDVDNAVDRSSMDEKSYINKKHVYSPAKLLWTHFRNAYTNVKVLQWSIWYAVGLCGYMQVISYVQLMWKEIETAPDMAWNGAVDAAFTALAALFSLIAGYIHTDRLKSRASLIILALVTALEGGAILLICWTQTIYVSYAGYITFGALYGFIITVSGAEVARYLEEDSFGLVFGLNTTISLVLQTVLTAVVTSHGLALSCRDQFTVYAFYFIGVGILYLTAVICEYLLAAFKTKNCD